MEITVLSAEGLKKPSRSIFSKPLGPFITLTTLTSSAPCAARSDGDGDEGGRVELKWGDKFHVHVSSSFFADLSASVHLQLYKKSCTRGWSQLGWCRVPATDIVSQPGDSVKYLSYRLWDRDGARSDGIINLAVKVGASLDTREEWSSHNGRAVTSQMGGSLDTLEKWSSDNGRAETSQMRGSLDTHERRSSDDGGAETSRTVIGIPMKYFQFPTM